MDHSDIEILKRQEDTLRFERFTRRDALALGSLMVERGAGLGLVVACSIRLASGAVVYQYLPDGTNLLNDLWMARKLRTVLTWESSSLRAALETEEKGEVLLDHGLDVRDYALCGGGFPIRLTGSHDVLGAVIASNLDHIADHEFVVGALREFLDVEVPSFAG